MPNTKGPDGAQAGIACLRALPICTSTSGRASICTSGSFSTCTVYCCSSSCPIYPCSIGQQAQQSSSGPDIAESRPSSFLATCGRCIPKCSYLPPSAWLSQLFVSYENANGEANSSDRAALLREDQIIVYKRWLEDQKRAEEDRRARIDADSRFLEAQKYDAVVAAADAESSL